MHGGISVVSQQLPGHILHTCAESENDGNRFNCWMRIKHIINRNSMLNSHLYTQCFPLTETWYLVYRNYEEDPAMGGTAKCVRGTQAGPLEGYSAPALLEYGTSVSV